MNEDKSSAGNDIQKPVELEEFVLSLEYQLGQARGDAHCQRCDHWNFLAGDDQRRIQQ
jgi:hypothetical protein